MTWASVGDVEGVVLRADPDADRTREVLPFRGGVVGYQLPLVRATVLAVKLEDMLIFATDGIRSSFVQEPLLRNPLIRLAQNGLRQLADHLLAHYRKATDDVLILVARYLGEGS